MINGESHAKESEKRDKAIRQFGTQNNKAKSQTNNSESKLGDHVWKILRSQICAEPNNILTKEPGLEGKFRRIIQKYGEVYQGKHCGFTPHWRLERTERTVEPAAAWKRPVASHLDRMDQIRMEEYIDEEMRKGNLIKRQPVTNSTQQELIAPCSVSNRGRYRKRMGTTGQQLETLQHNLKTN